MATVYFRACLALLVVCGAVATTADDGIGPGERVDKRLNPAIPMPHSTIPAPPARHSREGGNPAA